MKSMTGYGEAATHAKQVRVGVQLRTLNHRHLDLQVHAPRVYLFLEEEVRRKVRERIARGRVELFVTRSPGQQTGRRLELDEDLLEQYVVGLNRLRKRLGLKGEIDLPLLFRLPDLFHFREAEVGKGERALLLRTVEKALTHLELSREREGRHLKRDIEKQVSHLGSVSRRLRTEAERVGRGLRRALSLKDSGVQEGNRGGGENEQSVFKGDINEEVVRFGSHVEGLSGLLRAQGPVGKKFDFLLQEVQRELGTIGAKVPRLPVVSLVLAGKERVEKIREQVQNVE